MGEKLMNLIFDICHPGQVHLLKNLIIRLKNKKHKVIVTLKNIPAARELLNLYNIEFIDLGYKSDNIIGKAINQLRYDYEMMKIVNKEEIQLGFGSSVTLAHVSMFTAMNCIFLDDDDDVVEPYVVKYAHPFADLILSPSALQGNRESKKARFYRGYHELAYLHPDIFTPDPEVLKNAGVSLGEKYFILRFNAFKAHHDKGEHGITIENKKELINILKDKGKVFISAERNIEPEFEKYRINIPSHKIHSFLYYATMFIGDSQTMTSEAAVLGTPSLRCNSFVGRISYLEEQEKKYGLTYGFHPSDVEKLFNKIISLLSDSQLNEKWLKKRFAMLEEKINVTDFFEWIIENYPDSINQLINDKEFSLNYK